jgi:hypothetical protein
MGRWMGCLVNDLLDTARPHDERADGLGQPPVGTGAGIRGSSPYFPPIALELFPYFSPIGRTEVGKSLQTLAARVRLCPASERQIPCTGLVCPNTRTVSGDGRYWLEVADIPCKSALFGMTFLLDSAQPERNVPTFSA